MSTLTQEQIAYMQAHANQNKAPGFIACNVICGTAALVAVSLRFFTRRKTRVGFGWDDLFIFIAMFFYIAYIIPSSLLTRYGFGKHIIFATNAKGLALGIMIAEAFFNMVVMFVKMSIVALYVRLFPQKWLRIMSWTVGIVAILQNLPVVFLTIFQCTPISSQWDPEVRARAKCIDYQATIISAGALNIFTDFVILGMPIPIVWNLKMGSSKRLMLIAVFTTGLVACILDISRMAESVSLQSVDTTYDLVNTVFLTTVELMVGIISACAPTYGPLVKAVFKGARTTVDPTKDRWSTQHQDSVHLGPSRNRTSIGKGWDDLSDNDTVIEDETHQGKGIRVQTDYTVTVESPTENV